MKEFLTLTLANLEKIQAFWRIENGNQWTDFSDKLDSCVEIFGRALQDIQINIAEKEKAIENICVVIKQVQKEMDQYNQTKTTFQQKITENLKIVDEEMKAIEKAVEDLPAVYEEKVRQFEKSKLMFANKKVFKNANDPIFKCLLLLIRQDANLNIEEISNLFSDDSIYQKLLKFKYTDYTFEEAVKFVQWATQVPENAMTTQIK